MASAGSALKGSRLPNRSTFVALLRGINVGGHNKVPMKELKALCLELGLEDPRTVLASGNLIFESKSKSTATLAQKLEEGVKQEFGVSCRIFVLTAAEFSSVLQAARKSLPFRSSLDDGNKQVVIFLSRSAAPKAQQEFLEKHQGPELVEFGEHAVYIYYVQGQGRSKLDLSKTVELGTVRNRNTLGKIEELL